ncbi:hypothetical protein [Halobacterium rubrum]|uniref:hypothetical protein n=1 Tax=Halobacterium TaxID=2239 RepID=UPI001F212D35|nr:MULTISPECIES: hypothetical protein [Halobacterium]MDH5021025.1 hypothetical protein [Halobacterium rubrum]
MATESAQPSLHDVGYRRLILLAGALWGAAPALSYSFDLVPGGIPGGSFFIGVTVMTTTLAVLFQLDSETLAEHGTRVELAWSYALLAPVSIVVTALVGPGMLEIPIVGLLGILAGPPVASLVYVWQRGPEASVSA